MSPEEKKEVADIVDPLAAKLGEHFDSVQIFVTRHRGGDQETCCYEVGNGNFYARQGQVDEWLRIQHQYQRNYAIRKDNESEQGQTR